MGRNSGILFKLVEEAASQRKGGDSKWNKVFRYLKAHSQTDPNSEAPDFDSPLPPHTAPTDTLSVELQEVKGVPSSNGTVLKLAVSTAPAMIVAAICHLEPKTVSIADHYGRLPLHLACRRSSKEADTDIIIGILLSCYREALIKRDNQGRTPLHYLLAYHAPSRKTQMVELFCQHLSPTVFKGIKQERQVDRNSNPNDSLNYPLPEIPSPSDQNKVPPSVAIIHDAIEGALPLHYAVMFGATRDVLKVLLGAYPEGLYLGDRKGRTALAWYLGAGFLDDEPIHVNGDPIDPSDMPWWDKKLESSTVKVLITSRVARTADYTGRYPLHWASLLMGKNLYSGKSPGSCLSPKIIQILKDHHVEALFLGDLDGKSPLHLLFDSVRAEQALEWNRIGMNKLVRDEVDLVKGGPIAFNPPTDLIELLLGEGGEDRSTAFVEDEDGRLPIHAALEVATCASVVKLLIKTHPACLVHTTEELAVSPLHVSVMSPIVAPLQTIETMKLVLEAYVASRAGTYVDGRLALKMEDADGNYPIHYACRNQACLEVLKLFIEKYPKGSLLQNADGDLPLHVLLDANVFSCPVSENPPLGATLAVSEQWECEKDRKFRKEQVLITKQKVKFLVEPLLVSSNPADLLELPGSAHGMMPLHIAVAFGAIPYSTLSKMLEFYPQGASKTVATNGEFYSTLDLHSICKSILPDNYTTNEAKADWQNIRELLFSFHPVVEKHRHDEELLGQCVTLVRSEITGIGSFHLSKEKKAQPTQSIQMSERLTTLSVPEFEHGGRPFSRRNARSGRKSKSKAIRRSISSPSSKSDSNTNKSKSIYDDDEEAFFNYPVSEGSADEDDESFSGPETAEEYISDEYEENDSFDDDECAGPWNSAASKRRNRYDMGQGSGGRKTCVKFSDEKKEESCGNGCNDKSEYTTGGELDEINPELSDVGMRIFTFFVLFRNAKKPSDNYAQQVESILDDRPRSMVESLVSMQLPSCAQFYLENGMKLDGMTFRDLATPQCREVIQKLFYFLGKYEFASEVGGLLLHRDANCSTVVVRATEWSFITEEFSEAPPVEDGAVEAEIWETGIIPAEKVGYLESTFRVMKRNRCFVFTKNAEYYNNELKCRSDLGVSTDGCHLSNTHVVPLINHFNAQGIERSQDRQYRMDSSNDSFSTLHLFGGHDADNMLPCKSICLADYPFAFVLPNTDSGSLYEYFFRHNIEGPTEIRRITRSIGKALQCMHEKGIIHGGVNMRNVVLFEKGAESDDESNHHWALKNFHSASRLKDRDCKDNNCNLGGMWYDGIPQFTSSLLPPEMFLKLSECDLDKYHQYWDAVERIFNIKVDLSVVKPTVDFESGGSFVLRCHFIPNDAGSELSKQLPMLPYKLMPARESSDIWAFGCLLFALCTSGRDLFPTNIRTGHLLNYCDLANWSQQKAQAIIYEHVDNHLAQDILLQLLSSYEERSTMTMASVMTHPFFEVNSESSLAAEKIIEKQKRLSNSYNSGLKHEISRVYETEWLKKREVSVDCWDFDFLSRIQSSPTELVLQSIGVNNRHSNFPCSFIILPYRLSQNKRSLLTPTCKKDVERAEQVGIQLIKLSKACQFFCKLEQAVEKDQSTTRMWSYSEIIKSLNLSEDDFGDVHSELGELAAQYVELFRYDPLCVALKVVQGRIKGLLSLYDDVKSFWLYLVDEYNGVPVVGSVDSPYIYDVRGENKAEVLRDGLPFMYMSFLYYVGISGSIVGLVRLIFEAAFPHIPPSWEAAAKGLEFGINQNSITKNVRILRDALSYRHSTKYATTEDDDMSSMLHHLSELDRRRTFAGLQRVLIGEVALWTTIDGVDKIKKIAESSGLRKALIENSKKNEMLKSKDEEIKSLKEDLEKLKFRMNMRLEVPEENDVAESATGNFRNTVSDAAKNLFDADPEEAVVEETSTADTFQASDADPDYDLEFTTCID